MFLLDLTKWSEVYLKYCGSNIKHYISNNFRMLISMQNLNFPSHHILLIKIGDIHVLQKQEIIEFNIRFSEYRPANH